MKLEQLKSLTNRAAVVKVSTALNPLLWLTAVVTPAALLGSVLATDPTTKIGSLVLAAFPVLASVVAYFGFMFRDPDRLQSEEEYQLKQQQLILYQKGREAPILIEQTESVSQKGTLDDKSGGLGG